MNDITFYIAKMQLRSLFKKKGGAQCLVLPLARPKIGGGWPYTFFDDIFVSRSVASRPRAPQLN